MTQVTQVAAARPAYAAGARAAIATVAPLLLGSMLGWPNASWMGLAGFNVALADKGGTLRTRLGAMIPAAFYGTLAAVGGALAGRHPASAVALLAAWAIAAGVARSYGAAAIGIGTLSLATLVISTEQPASLIDALQRGGAILGGAAFAIALSLLLGRFRLYRPARIAVARVYRMLANGDDVRDAVAVARRTLTQLRRGMHGESPRGERLLVLLESADRLSRSVDANPQLHAVLLAMADAIDRERYDPALVNPETGASRETLDTALRALRELQDQDHESRTPFSVRTKIVDPIRGTFTWDSAVLRHALRVALSAGLAAALTRSFHIERGYWFTLTVVVVLQPYTSATLQRGLQRVAGTVAGAIVAALLLSVLHTPAQIMFTVFVGAALTVAVLPVNYGLFSFVLTPTFVLLAEVHALDRHLVWLRVSNTLFGALLAWLAAWLLWPASERGRVRDDLVSVLYALAELTRCVAECDESLIDEARRAFFVALENAEASLQRVLSDTGRESTASEEAMMAVLIYARRHASDLKVANASRQASTFIAGLATAVAQQQAPSQDEVPESLAGLQSAVARLTEDASA
jgi:uncharacterized membrane protein YccC